MGCRGAAYLTQSHQFTTAACHRWYSLSADVVVLVMELKMACSGPVGHSAPQCHDLLGLSDCEVSKTP